MKYQKPEDVLQLEAYLQSTGASAPIPQHDIKYLLDKERAVLVKIYKRTGHYTLIVGAVLYLMYGFRRIGITFSYSQSVAILIVLTTAAVCVIGVIIFIRIH